MKIIDKTYLTEIDPRYPQSFYRLVPITAANVFRGLGLRAATLVDRRSAFMLHRSTGETLITTAGAARGHIYNLLHLPLLSGVNSGEALATAAQTEPLLTPGGIFVLACLGALGLCSKAIYKYFTTPRKPGAAGTGDGPDSRPDAPGAGDKDPYLPAPGDIGPGGHEYALPQAPPPDANTAIRAKEIAESILGAPPSGGRSGRTARAVEHVIESYDRTAEYIPIPDIRINQVLFCQIRDIIYNGLPFDRGYPSESLDGLLPAITRFVYTEHGVLLQVSRPGGVIEQARIPRELIAHYDMVYRHPGPSLHRYPPELFPTVEPFVLTTPSEYLTFLLFYLGVPAGLGAIYTWWRGPRGRQFHLRFHSRITIGVDPFFLGGW